MTIPRDRHWLEVFKVFLRLGLTSFGGPVAHLGYFREEFVTRRKWLDDRVYADLVALCQFLPGPASSQVGIAIGLSRAGYGGALAAWTGFTLPSAVLMTLFAYGVGVLGDFLGVGWVHGLKAAAVAVVAQAVLGMARTLTPDLPRAMVAGAATAIALLVPSTSGQIGAILFGAACGLALPRVTAAPATGAHLPLTIGRRAGAVFLALFVLLLAGLPLLMTVSPSHGLAVFEAFYRSGSLVFGGGHVVLPLLQASVVEPGWVGDDVFLAGYGAAQAIPGPLFTFSAYLGAVMGGWTGAMICLIAIFLPSLLLVPGALPFWEDIRRKPMAQTALRGVNAAVVGLLLAALYDPVFIAGIQNAGDLILAVAAFLLLVARKTPPWLVVAISAAGGALLAA